MADLSKIKLNGTTYNFKDATARASIPETYVASVNGNTGTTVVDKLQTSAISNNTDYNLLGTTTANNNTSVVTIYQQTPLSFSKTSSLARLTIGSTSLPGQIRLYSNVTNATGYTTLVSGTTGSSARTITFPNASGTVALTSDIPNPYDDTALAARVTALENIPWVTYYTGSNTPSNNMGTNGDLYFQTSEA